jgi:hypothetical protein
MKDKNCPICYPQVMGIGPEGWRAIEELHFREHIPKCPTCKQPITN